MNTNANEPTIDAMLCNARLRTPPRDGAEPVLKSDDTSLPRFGWVGGRVWVDQGVLAYLGSEHIPNPNGRANQGIALGYTCGVDVAEIEKVEKRRGIVGVPYVSVHLSDGSDLQLRVGAGGSKSDVLVQAIEAERAAR